MNREEIIRLAREAGLLTTTEKGCQIWMPDNLEAFAALIAAAEREECAEICDRVAMRYGEGPEVEHYLQGFGAGAFLSAKKIRARGEQE
jgi:hypothetical protein